MELYENEYLRMEVVDIIDNTVFIKAYSIEGNEWFLCLDKGDIVHLSITQKPLGERLWSWLSSLFSS